MTQIQKERTINILNLAYRVFVLGGIGILIFSMGVYKEEIKQLTFTDSKTKIETEMHVKNSLTFHDIMELKGHIHNPDFHMPKHEKDSFYVTRKEYEEMVIRNITTTWQLKEEMKEIKKLLKEMQHDTDIIKKNLKK